MPTKPWPALRERMTPQQKAQAEAFKTALQCESLALDELRAARKMTQTQLAEVLRVEQSAISKVERRADMYISTLRSYIEAMGGDLRIQAVFREGTIDISLFKEIA